VQGNRGFGEMKKYKVYGKGWFNEPYRHSLAARGIKTRHTNFAILKDIQKLREKRVRKILEEVRPKETEFRKIKGAILAQPLTEQEEREYLKQRLISTLTRRGARKQWIREFLKNAVPREKGEDKGMYLERALKELDKIIPLDAEIGTISTIDPRTDKLVERPETVKDYVESVIMGEKEYEIY